MTAIKRGELNILRQIVYRYDPKAFIIVGDARQVLGQGFSKLEDEVRFDAVEVEQKKIESLEGSNSE
jgi:metallophosphoesterase superfamily enzyme